MDFSIIILGVALVVLSVIVFLLLKKNDTPQQDVTQHPLVLDLQLRIQNLEQELRGVRTEKELLVTQVASSQEKLNSAAQQLNNLEEVKNQLKMEFQVLAQSIFDDKSAKFSQVNKDQLDAVLTPFKEKLKEFENKVEKVYKEENSERIQLKSEIRLLAEQNVKLMSEANNLASALKGDNKMQGNWGELILEKILERSGLIEGTEFKTQYSDNNSEGSRIKPDVVVFLPEDKHLIIDSKVSMNAYTAFQNAVDEAEKSMAIKQHVESVRAHIKGLGEKNYQTASTLKSPDFTMLFIPIESAFATALQFDTELYQFAWDRNIVLVSPTTLLATLRTVSSIWKQERRNRNTQAIAEEGANMYDKFVLFVKDMSDIGVKLEQTKSVYEDAMNKLTEGRGNLVKRAEKMRQLGAKGQKTLPQEMIDRSIETDTETEE